jgi:hypothetical protein
VAISGAAAAGGGGAASDADEVQQTGRCRAHRAAFDSGPSSHFTLGRLPIAVRCAALSTALSLSPLRLSQSCSFIFYLQTFLI